MDAVVLLSGGIDSAVILAMNHIEGKNSFALSFDYGQRHRLELFSAAALCRHYQVPHQIIKLPNQAFGNSSLVTKMDVPKRRSTQEMCSQEVPNTYVPARNTLFLSFALGQAEMKNASEIQYGATKMDLSGYPDCRPDYIHAFQQLINCATKQAVEGNPPKLQAPLLDMTKKEIIEKGADLDMPFELTLSCYDPTPTKHHCGLCDACVIRQEGFKEAKVADPTVYTPG